MKIEVSKLFRGLACAAALTSASAFADAFTDDYPLTSATEYLVGVTPLNGVKIGSGEYLAYKINAAFLRQGSAYTFIMDSASSEASISVCYAYSEDGMADYDELGDSSSDLRTEGRSRTVITGDSWIEAGISKDPDDPDSDLIKPTAYYLLIEGEAGSTVTVRSQSGAVYEPVPEGVFENPVKFGTPTEAKAVSKSATITVDDDYWYYGATFAAGVSFKLTVTGATNVVLGAGMPVFKTIRDEEAKTITLILKPEQTVTTTIQLQGKSGTKFTIKATADPKRPIADHPLANDGLPLEDKVEVPVNAGARNDSGGAFVDEIIDTELFAVDLKAGRIAVFESRFTTETNFWMEVYDSTGKKIFRNAVKAPGEIGQKIAFVPEADGRYYVGVCLADLETAPEGGYETVAGTLLYTDGGEAVEKPDDKPEGGVTVTLGLGESAERAVQGAGRAFGVDNYEDWLVLGGVKGVTYDFKATTESPVGKRPLNISVYTLSSKGVPELVQDLKDGGAFKAPANRTYYVKVSLTDGHGCDCAYQLKAWVDATTYAGYGFLRADIKGPTDGVWYLDSKTSETYASGVEVLVAAGSYSVKGKTVSGWKAPAASPATVLAGQQAAPYPVLVKYTDTSDHGDDVKGGAKSISVTRKSPFVVSRSLWYEEDASKDDPADWFKLSAAADTVYDFAITDNEGSAIVVVYADSACTEVIGAGKDLRLPCVKKATWYAKVIRAEGFEKVDSAYEMTVRSCNIGQVKTDKSSYSVSEKGGYLSVKFSRTAKEGRVRVRYTTVEDSAKEHEQYEPQSGILTWEDGDKSAQTVKIKIIPSLVDEWKADTRFTINVDTIDEDEYRPSIALTEIPVTITSGAKVTPGTISFAGWGKDMDPFAKPTKPTATVRSDDVLTLWLSRSGGASKTVGVKVTVTAKQTDDARYVVTDSQEVIWSHNEDSAKPIYIQTMRPTDEFFADKTFTVKLTALSLEAKPSVKNGSCTVTVTDSKTARSFADGSTATVTLKASPANTWYFDDADFLRSTSPAARKSVQLTATVSGSGRLVFAPEFLSDDPNATCEVKIGRETIPVDGYTPIERWINASGKTTVTVTVKRGTTAVGESYATFHPQGVDGDPFLWEPLVAPALVAPRLQSNELLLPTGVDLAWETNDNPRVRYRIHIDKNKSQLGKTTALFTSLRDDQEQGTLNTYPFMTGGKFCTACEGYAFDANTTYSWRIDPLMLDDDGKVALVLTNKTVWTFKTAAAGGLPIPKVASGVDADGRSVAEAQEKGEPVRFVQGVNVDVAFGATNGDDEPYAGVAWSAVGILPKGLSLSKAGRLTGGVQKAGSYYICVQPKVGTRLAGPAIGFDAEVESIGLAAGTFAGLVQPEETEDVPNLNQTLGSVSVTAKESGEVTASVKVGATSYSFDKAKCYDAVTNFAVVCWTNGTGDVVTTNWVGGEAAATVRLTKKVTLLRQACTNELVITTCRGSADGWDNLDCAARVEMKVHMLSEDGTTFRAVRFAGRMYRDNTKLTGVLAAEGDYVGYYTANLPASSGAAGSGYLTLTVDAKGKVKFVGNLADGKTSFSGSATAGYVRNTLREVFDDEGELVCVTNLGSTLAVPVYYAKNSTTFGGWVELCLRPEAEVTLDGQESVTGNDLLPVLRTGCNLVWINADPHAYRTESEIWQPWAEVVTPEGGYYSTVINLQAYYKDYRFRVADLGVAGELPYDLLDEGYSFVAYPGIVFDGTTGKDRGLYVDCSVNSLSVDKSKLAYRLDERGKKTKLIDWSASVNPCKFTLSFKRATGISTGSFDLYEGLVDEETGVDTVQKKLGSYKYAGITVMTADGGAPRAAMRGYYTVPQSAKDGSKKYSWNDSYELDLELEDWTETEGL